MLRAVRVGSQCQAFRIRVSGLEWLSGFRDSCFGGASQRLQRPLVKDYTLSYRGILSRI